MTGLGGGIAAFAGSASREGLRSGGSGSLPSHRGKVVTRGGHPPPFREPMLLSSSGLDS